ncbi:CGNR zinc finger domain-containing protein [Leifsonia sp. F6_8S_P_1B]|uniref:CGNR zinc finger domain-containing protein n=1 Tax=Leifsonia williamsii TaxID=3035919 RepID=A0ABT8K6X8_9MICO|nr:CGNR zinc finger domain-containing protein [Leifsonia williamsii]MDN4613196.1 CGNR zinc finger domain-containing protein [Leifsonia williamsii]
MNTVEYQVDEEGWVTPGDLGAWLRARDLLDGAGDDAPTSDDLALALTIREGLRSVLATHAGHDADTAAIARLDDALAELPVRVSFAAADGFGLLPASGRPVRRALARVVEAVRASTEEGTWPRLKVCDRDSCRWAYYDYSKNRSGRWCTMAGCGNAVKMQKAHARRSGGAA